MRPKSERLTEGACCLKLVGDGPCREEGEHRAFRMVGVQVNGRNRGQRWWRGTRLMTSHHVTRKSRVHCEKLDANQGQTCHVTTC